MGYKSKIYKSGFQKGYTPWNKGRKVVFSEEHLALKHINYLKLYENI